MSMSEVHHKIMNCLENFSEVEGTYRTKTIIRHSLDNNYLKRIFNCGMYL